VLTLALLFIQPAFLDVTAAYGLGPTNDNACWIDLNNGGWTDLVAGGTVWINEKGKKFVRLQDGVGSCVAGDFDNDGYADLFSYSQQKLYRNVHGQKFEPFSLPSLPATSSRGACWGDFNNDGFIDLYVGGFEDWDRQITYPSFVLMNEAGKSFKVTWKNETYRTRGVTACDFNRSGKLSVYASNYRLQPNNLYINFVDQAAAYNVVATSPGFDGGHSIGAAWGDFDNDGEFDLFAGNFAHVDSRGDQPKSRFLANLGKKGGYKFEDKGTCGVYYQESYASPAAGDFDNDGNLDLLFTTVYGTASFGRPNFPMLYRNTGDFKFVDATQGSGAEKLQPTYQAAWADFNNDGKLDLICGGKLFLNQTPDAHWLEMTLSGDGKRVNKGAIGAQMRVTAGKRMLSRQVEAGTGEGNQNDSKLHFGLGDYRGKVTVEVTWPDGAVKKYRGVGTNRSLSASR